MFGNLFGKRSKARSLDDLIRDIADAQKPEDYAEFFKRLPQARLFMKLLGEVPATIPRGVKHQVRSGETVSARTATVQGLEVVVLFTSNTDARLGAQYAEIELQEALHMVERTPALGGLLVQSTGTGWVGMDRAKVSHLLALQA